VKVLFDANVVLDILLKRPGFAASAIVLAKVPEPWISALSIANICYIVGRSRRDRISVPLEFMRGKFHIAAISSSTIGRAVDLGFKDFEDALQIAAAGENRVRHLVTRNPADFQSTPDVEVLSVPTVLERLRD
jgi:predicted nucleic acid-binding protein